MHEIISARHAPVLHEQRAALVELTEGPGLLDAAVVEAFGDDAHERAGLPLRYPHPRLLYPGCDVALVRDPRLLVLACYAGGVVRYQPLADDRREGYVLAHELAHGHLGPSRFAHNHVDVQRVACAYLVPGNLGRALISRHGPAGARRTLISRHRYCPPWVAEYRVHVLAALMSRSAA